MNKNCSDFSSQVHTGSNPGKLTSACWIRTNTPGIVFSLSCPALIIAFMLSRANFKLSHKYFQSTGSHCHVLESAGSCSSSAVRWGEVRWGEVRWGREAQCHHFPPQGGQCWPPGALGPPFCATTGAFEAMLSPLQHAWVVVCVSTTTLIVGSLKYPLQTLRGVSFAVWGAPRTPERRCTHGSRGPGTDACNAACPQAGWSPLRRQAHCGVAGLRGLS